jgi:hypothetical protein
VDRKQLGSPILETGRVEGPATGVRKSLSLRKVELCLFTLFNVEVNPDPIQKSSIARSQGFGAQAIRGNGVVEEKGGPRQEDRPSCSSDFDPRT